MKKLSLVISLSLFFSAGAYCQLCKLAKVGMSSAELIKAVGRPDSTTFSGMNDTDSLMTWHYGGQSAVLSGDKIQKLIMDPKKEGQLNQKVVNGDLSPEEFEKQLEELNENSCK